MRFRRIAYAPSCLLLLLANWPCTARESAQTPFELECRDGFTLEGRIQTPETQPDDGEAKVIILIHGSGPQSMDEDLTAVTKGRKENLFFRDLSAALADVGFTVLRYHKRSYQFNLLRKEDPAVTKGEAFAQFADNPLKFFVEDAIDCARYAQAQFPDADIFLLGHSQGAYIALQVADQMPEIKGVALVSFALSSLDTLVFEQVVYRSMATFERLDTDGDAMLDTTEYGGEDAIARSLKAQLAVLDLDGDQKISMDEFRAGNLSNLIVRDIGSPAYRQQEAKYPRSAEILKNATFKVAFIQGLWDNQTPAYNAKAVELVARHVWRKKNFRFHYFPKLGHALDARDAYDDIQYNVIDPGARKELAEELATFF